MFTIVASLTCFFGIFEFFALLGIFDFSWAITKGSYHGLHSTINGSAHWVYKGTNTHVRNATAKDIEIHNRNVQSGNAYAEKQNANIRRQNKGAMGRGFSEWMKAPFLMKYGTKRRWFPPVATAITFLFVAYSEKDFHLLFTEGPGLMGLVLLAINLIYVAFFCFAFVFMHDVVCGDTMIIFNKNHYRYKKNGIARLCAIVTYIFKFLVMLTTILYLLRGKSSNPDSVEGVEKWFFVIFIVFSILVFAYILGWFFSGIGTGTKDALRDYEKAKRK